VHTDARAAQSASAVNSLAYTVGRGIVFGVGYYAPATRQGQQLLAHELVHTIQQGQSISSQTGSLVIDGPHTAAENEAEHLAQQALQPALVQTVGPGHHSFVHMIKGSGQPEEEGEEAVTTSEVEAPVVAQRVPQGLILQRRARALWPVDRWENPAARLARGDVPAQTELEMNGQLIQSSVDLDRAIPSPNVVGRPTNSGFDCKIDNSIDLTCRNRRITPWADQNGAWWSRIPVTTLQGLGFSQCSGVSAPNGVRFKLTATPSARALTRRIIRSEYEHVMDTFAAFRSHLVPLHDRYAHHSANTTTGTDATTCATTILQDIDRNRRINDFLVDYIARQQAHDGPGGDHNTNAPMTVNAACTLAHAVAQV